MERWLVCPDLGLRPEATESLHLGLDMSIFLQEGLRFWGADLYMHITPKYRPSLPREKAVRG
jgi:hypothetical protein